MRPNQSVEVCAQKSNWVTAGHEAIQKWSTVLGRWGHFKVNPCNSGSDLKINMQPFGQTGLNYFTENPGRIFIQSSASGDFLKAVVLHEFGHSFGLCDQYKDAGSAGCSSSRSDRQENSEVMGQTNAGKIQLTPGDIKGVQTIAQDPGVRSTAIWSQYLANSPTTPDQSNGQSAYVAIDGSTGQQTPLLLISVPSGSTPVLCQINGSGDVGCDSANTISIQKRESINDRDFFETSTALSTLNSTSENRFVVMLGTKKIAFKVKAIGG
ncbi:MAG: hypothetical protein NT027_09250 [Proteobacteria bacterium]|nr:hypothetical protein [Pseudomonadota bacterium]